MAAQNLELLERFADALNRGEIPDGLLTDDFVIVNAVTAVTDKTYRGREGGLEWRRDVFDVFKDPRFEYRVDKEAPDFVVTRLRVSGEAAASGMELDLRWMAVIWFRDGKVARAAGFNSREEAYQAVGLPVEPRPTA